MPRAGPQQFRPWPRASPRPAGAILALCVPPGKVHQDGPWALMPEVLNVEQTLGPPAQVGGKQGGVGAAGSGSVKLPWASPAGVAAVWGCGGVSWLSHWEPRWEAWAL